MPDRSAPAPRQDTPGAGGQLVTGGAVEGADDVGLAARDGSRDTTGVGMRGVHGGQVGEQGLGLVKGALVADGLHGLQLAGGDGLELGGVPGAA